MMSASDEDASDDASFWSS